jgi:hypothetical protein
MTPASDYFCLSCLGTAVYMAFVDLIDGTEAWLHIGEKCNIRMEFCGVV